MRQAPGTGRAKVQAALAAFLLGVLWGDAHGDVYQCIGESGEMLLTDTACPPGYTTDFIVADPLVTRGGQSQAIAGEHDVDSKRRQAAQAEAARSQAELEAGRLRAELEAARLRAELERERLRTIERKLDALLERPTTYGAVAVVPYGVVPKPFAACIGKKGETPWVNCRPPRDDLQPLASPDKGPFCGIVGCTPGITRSLDRDRPSPVIR